MMNCKDCQNELPELLLDHASVSERVNAHLEACADCRAEYKSLQATFKLMDEWEAPEPSAFFDQRLAAHLRAEIAAPPVGFLSRLHDRFMFSSSLQLRPALAGMMALVLIVGGGTFAGVYHSTSTDTAAVQPSAAINDLQILDSNQQAIQQMDQLLSDESDANGAQSQPSI